MAIAPIILQRHPGLDPQQRAVVGHKDGPMLVIAGPGAGKSLSIELRAINLLLTGRAEPEGLVLCTFGRDAAHHLRKRFAESASACGVGDISGVRIATIHSLCHRVLAPHAGLVGLRHDYGVLDEREQHLLLHQEFDAIFGPDWGIFSSQGWRGGAHGAAEAARYFDRICDELIDPVYLARSERPFIATLGRSCLRYRALLQERNVVDFAHLQLWAEQVLRNGDIAAEVGGGIHHLAVDEAQDTSYVQLGILKRLAEVHRNIAIVGDDDQMVYRFRGASVTLMQFPKHFPDCRVVKLEINYRSHRDIVAACGAWMETAADWSPPGGGDQPFRFRKNIAAHAPETHHDYPAVIAVQEENSHSEGRRLGELLRFLRRSGVIASYGQVVLLLNSVKDVFARHYLHNLESAGVPARCEPAGHAHAPAGDEVVITTIHQAKGRQWDMVIVGSLSGPDLETDRVGRNLYGYCAVPFHEPVERIGDFDRARRHYVAFTRAKHMLVLTATGEPHPRFSDIWNGATRWPDVDRDALARQRFGAARNRSAPPVFEIGHLNRLVVRVGSRRRAS